MNYYEHEVNVKVMDGLLVNSQEWQWMIDYIEDHNIISYFGALI